MKRLILVHGWSGNPDNVWFPWFKGQAAEHGFEITAPQLPEADAPSIKNWIPALAEAVGRVDENTYFVGHSMACQTIVRFLETLPEDQVAGGAVFVAGFFRPLTGLADEKEKETDRGWYTVPVDFDRARQHLKRSVALFSDDDPFVPVENAEDFKEKLGSAVIIQHNKGHFSRECTELPIALEKLLELSK